MVLPLTSRIKVGIDLPELIRLKRGCTHLNPWIFFPSRDWSAWIDTIETLPYIKKVKTDKDVGIDLPELIRLKLFASNAEKTAPLVSRDWSAWIDTIETFSAPQSCALPLSQVGIDLPELIRLKHSFTSALVSSKPRSGLICLNWYDWNFVGYNLPLLSGA